MKDFPKHSAQYWLKKGLATAQLGSTLGTEVVGVVEAVHANIAQPALPVTLNQNKPKRVKTRGITRLVYQAVRGGFNLTEWSLKNLSQLLEVSEEDVQTLPVLAAINGIFGDLLAESDNDLAIPMQWLQTAHDNKSVVFFVHGLCMSEQAWANPAQQDWLTHLPNHDVAYLRYNTGKHISHNGRELAALLEERTAAYDNVVIVGHSMGGLLTRSASYYAQQVGMPWIKKLSHVATLGTPYHGAPLERLGNAFNSLFLVSPYSASFANLGNLRSAGIRDLRHGNVLDEDWQQQPDFHVKQDQRLPVALLPDTQYLFIAGTRSESLAASPENNKHDLLVQVPSALGLHADPNKNIPNEQVTQHILPATDHMQLPQAQPAYTLINTWLQSTV